MRERDAINQGFNYTGMSCNAWHKDDWAKMKARADAIKKKYKGADYRVIQESCRTRYGSVPWKNIYGNEIFQKAQYYDEDAMRKWLDEGYQEALDKLKKTYDDGVAVLNIQYEKEKANYEYMMSIKREVKSK